MIIDLQLLDKNKSRLPKMYVAAQHLQLYQHLFIQFWSIHLRNEQGILQLVGNEP